MSTWEEDDEVMESLLESLSSSDLETRLDAAEGLGEMCQDAYGADGAAFGAKMRELGGLKLLTSMLSEPALDMQAQVLLIIGNLCSDAVDYHSSMTKYIHQYPSDPSDQPNLTGDVLAQFDPSRD